MSADEIVDVVDEYDHVVGALPRSRLVVTRSNHRVVHLLLRDGRGRLLLQRPSRASGKTFEWGSSVAGHVRSGESYEAAAFRECSEELGIAPERLIAAGTTWIDEGGRRKFIGVFVGEESGSLSPDPSEVERVEAIPLPEVRRLLREKPESFSPTFARAFHFARAQGHLS